MARMATHSVTIVTLLNTYHHCRITSPSSMMTKGPVRSGSQNYTPFRVYQKLAWF